MQENQSISKDIKVARNVYIDKQLKAFNIDVLLISKTLIDWFPEIQIQHKPIGEGGKSRTQKPKEIHNSGPEKREPLCVIKWRGYDSLMFCSYKHRERSTSTDGFWSFAKERLIKHHGISRKKFLYYIKEMDWRYSNRGKDFFEVLVDLMLH